MVTGWTALVVPTAWVAKLMLLGDNVTSAATPVPDSCMVSGLSPALSVRVITPGFEPVTVGVKDTWILQAALAATEDPQLLVCEYSALVVMLVISNVAFPVLVTVRACVALLVLRV